MRELATVLTPILGQGLLEKTSSELKPRLRLPRYGVAGCNLVQRDDRKRHRAGIPIAHRDV
jgi:hypothetical protein